MNDQGAKAKPAILLADDSKLVRFTAAKVLGDEFDLHQAENGAEALEKLAANPAIQLVLSDLQMPVLDGFGLLEKIRQGEDERLRQLPVIVITGADNKDEPKERAMKLGATDFITKPFDHAHLIARVRAHVGHQRQTRTLMDQVNVDTITGLLNRDGFESRLAKDTAFVTRHGLSLAVMLIQLDNYKGLFEQVGRSGYDKVIRQIAGMLQQSLRKEDTVARAGLAQFLISLPTARADSANELACRLAAKVEAVEIRVNGKPWKLSLSIGVYTVPQGAVAEAAAVLQGVRQSLEQSLVQGDRQISVAGVNAQSVPSAPSFSLDQLLTVLEKGGQLPAQITTEQLAIKLKPLLALLSGQQRSELFDQ